MSPDRSLYFCGDFFVSENAPVHDISRLFSFASGGQVLANLEGSCRVAGAESSGSKAVALSLSETLADALPDNVKLSLANNHSLDFGLDSLRHTESLYLDHLLGIRKNDDSKLDGQRIVFMVDRREACDAATLGCHRFSLRAAESLTDLPGAIVVVHGGIEYREYPTVMQRRIAERLIDRGALAVVFHQSHVPGIVHRYGDGHIFYGLGNFFFSEVMGLHGANSEAGMILRLAADRRSWSFATVTQATDPTRVRFTEFNPIENIALSTLPEPYADYYRSKYPLDGSLRPRQLDSCEPWLDLKFKVWLWVAGLLVRLGLTTRLKRTISKLKGR